MSNAANLKTSMLKTRPLIKPLVTMNKKNLQQWEIKLGPMQVTVIVSVVVVSMISAFVFGKIIGEGIGFDAALSASTSQTPKIPIVRDDTAAEMNPEAVSRVYAKLGTLPKITDDGADHPEYADGSDLSPVKTNTARTALDEVAGGLIDAEADKLTPELGDPAGVLTVNPLEEPAAEELVKKEDGRTLGAMIQAEQEKEILPPVQEDPVKPVEVKKSVAKAVVSEPIIRKPEPKKPTPVKKVERPVITKLAQVEERVSSPYVRDVIGSGWYAQVSAPKQLRDAEFLSRRLQHSGFPVVVEKANVRGEKYFRVLVGPEDNREQAQRLKSQLLRESYLQGDPFIKRVK